MHPAVNPSPPTTHQPPPPQDENQKVKTITALSLAALAEASSPYGIESFDDVLEPLWKGIRSLRGKVGTARWFILGQCVCLLEAPWPPHPPSAPRARWGAFLASAGHLQPTCAHASPIF